MILNFCRCHVLTLSSRVWKQINLVDYGLLDTSSHETSLSVGQRSLCNPPGGCRIAFSVWCDRIPSACCQCHRCLIFMEPYLVPGMAMYNASDDFGTFSFAFRTPHGCYGCTCAHVALTNKALPDSL